jgi:hypothetical protein
MAADKLLMKKIRNLLESKLPDEKFIDVSASWIRDNIHVMVMSRKFAKMNEKKKQEYLWRLINDSDLTKEQKLRISLVLPLSPEDVK